MKRNYLLDLFRAILTISVLFYHLGLCEAGFLAVCSFFTISGYLLAISINDCNFNLKKYYLKRIKALYLPLIIVTFITVFVFRYIVDIPWVTIKQETLSVIFGYNNFFQIATKSNYFIRSDASPFTHMWYISILIQIEFIFPLLILGFRKLKLNYKYLYLLLIISIGAFLYIDNYYGMANSYYHTLSRLYSFLIGYLVYYLDYINTDNKKAFICLATIICIFLCGELSQKYYVLLMMLVSILSGLFILLSKHIEFKEIKIVNYICKISYFVYLVQYPIIYIINTSLALSKTNRVLIELLLTIGISIIFTYALDKTKYKFNKYIYCLLILLSITGAYEFITCPNYYKEMEQLKVELEVNQDILARRQADYLDKIKDQHNLAVNNIAQIDEALNNLDETVKNTQVLMIGDSIMLGGSFNIDEYFNNCYCDAKGSRNGYLAYETLSDLLNRGIVGDYIVIHLGTNSGLELEEVESISTLLTDQKVIWLTVTNGWRTSENPMLEEYCATHENNYLADWYNYSLGHKEYFISDGLHLSNDGRHIYDQFIFDSLKEVIKDDLQTKKQNLIDEYNNQNNNTVSFYGNDLLINLYQELGDDYLYYADSTYTFDSLYNILKQNKDDLTLSKTIFILLDKSVILSEKDINMFNELLCDNVLHIITSKSLSSDCFLEDGIHLNQNGNNIIIEEIKECLN